MARATQTTSETVPSAATAATSDDAPRRADERRPEAPAASTGQVVVLTGLSGAGKSQASKLFEDLGYYCVDNLPPELLERFLDLREADPERYDRVALVLDIRAGDPASAIERARATLQPRGIGLPPRTRGTGPYARSIEYSSVDSLGSEFHPDRRTT